MRVSPIIALVMLGAAIPMYAPLAQQREPSFRSGSRTVAIFATVKDAAGRLVPDLTRDDFEIYDNGRKQAMTVFVNDLQPITVVLMLDRSGSMVGNFNLVRAASEQFVTELLPSDKARIGSFANRIQVDPREFTSSHRDLLTILRTQLQEAGPTPLWNAVNVGITSLLHQDGRRVVLAFTDGMDRPMTQTNVTLREVMKRAAEEDVMVYAIGLASRGGLGGGRRGGGGGFGGRGRGGGGGVGGGGARRSGEVDRPDPGLQKIAAETGGGYFELTRANDLAATFARVVEELHRQYALAFSPAKLDGKTHKLEVRMRNRFLTARTRTSYVAKPE